MSKLLDRTTIADIDLTDDCAVHIAKPGTPRTSWKGTVGQLKTLFGGLQKIKVASTYDQWQPNGTAFGDLIIGSIPAGAIIMMTKTQATIPFQNAGATLTKVALLVMDANTYVYQTGDGVGTPYGITGSPIDNVLALHPVATNPITLEIDLSADPLAPIIDDLVAGTVETTIWYII